MRPPKREKRDPAGIALIQTPQTSLPAYRGGSSVQPLGNGARRLRLTYRAIHFVQRPFGFLFWLLEQRKAKLADRLANMGKSLRGKGAAK